MLYDCDIWGVEEGWRHLLCRAPPALPPFRDVGLASGQATRSHPSLVSVSISSPSLLPYSLHNYSPLFSLQAQDLDATSYLLLRDGKKPAG